MPFGKGLGLVGAGGALIGLLASPAGAAVTISSADDQYFVEGGPVAGIATITITDDATTPEITAANDIRVRIPAGFDMTWDTTDSDAVLGGTAAANVSTSVAYEDSARTLVLDVTTDFLAGDQLTVAGLGFANFGSASPSDSLEVEVNDDGMVTAEDDKAVTIWAAVSTRSSAVDVANDGLEVWVVNPDHASVAVIATQGPNANTLLAEVPVGREPWCVDVHPTNGEVWVSSLADDQVYIVDAASRTVVDSIAAGFETFGVAFDPTGTTALVTASGSDEIFAIDVASRSVIATIAAERRPRGIVWSADGERAWVTHLLTPEDKFFTDLTTVFPDSWTTAPILLSQVFEATYGGYLSTVQNATLSRNGQTLWIPCNLINTALTGELQGNPLTPLNILHAIIRPVTVATSQDRVLDTYYLSEEGSPNLGWPGTGTPVGGPIAVDFWGGQAFVVNLHSENVTILDNDIFNPSEIGVLPVGRGPIGIAIRQSTARAYVANWLSRDVTVLNTFMNTVVATVPTTTSEVLPPGVLNGKQLFFTSTGAMSLDGRGACASCHVWATTDTRDWDLTQFGKFIRATPDIRGIGFTGPHDWTADKDEMQDHNFGILEFTGGAGLLPGGGNPPLGPPNRGLSADMDDIGSYMATLTHRTATPFLLPDGSQTAEADSGEVLFNDPVVGCATCHSGPFFTDSSLQENPFIKHDVGTVTDSLDVDGAAGLDTPSLIGVWDTAPYLHKSTAPTLEDVLTTSNPNDLHGTTSHLSAQQIDWLVAYLRSIAWPESTGTAVDSPLPGFRRLASSLDGVFPNPFDDRTSLRFSVERNPSDVRIDVFDVRGRRVRTLIDRPLTRGTHVVGWDSRDERGRRVASGAYFARLTVGGEPAGGKKLIVLH